jgi:hypothetical protein
MSQTVTIDDKEYKVDDLSCCPSYLFVLPEIIDNSPTLDYSQSVSHGVGPR